MKKFLTKYPIAACTFSVYVTDDNSCCEYELPSDKMHEAKMYISLYGSDKYKSSLMSGLMHEAIEAYFHMMQLVSEPIYTAIQTKNRRTFYFTHDEFTEAMADVSGFIYHVYPLLVKESVKYFKNKKKEEHEEKVRNKRKQNAV